MKRGADNRARAYDVRILRNAVLPVDNADSTVFHRRTYRRHIRGGGGR